MWRQNVVANSRMSSPELFLGWHVVANTSSQIIWRRNCICDHICYRNCICNDNRRKKVAANMSSKTTLIWRGIECFTTTFCFATTFQKCRRKYIIIGNDKLLLIIFLVLYIKCLKKKNWWFLRKNYLFIFLNKFNYFN